MSRRRCLELGAQRRVLEEREVALRGSGDAQLVPGRLVVRYVPRALDDGEIRGVLLVVVEPLRVVFRLVIRALSQ